MVLSLTLPYQNDCLLNSSLLSSTPFKIPRNCSLQNGKKPRNMSVSVTCSPPKIVRSPSLDNMVVRQNRIRFVQKLKTLLLSKPKHYIPIHILSKCRSYLSLSDSRSIISMIHRYPSIFELFTIPTPPTPFNATKSGYQRCVRLTAAAASLATKECNLQLEISINLANKLQKLLMMSSHRRLLLSKLVHLAPDLGLPPNFRSRLCNDHPNKFKTVDTSYGRALELVSWDSELAVPLSPPNISRDLIVDRPLKFKQLRLRKGLNVKRCHQEFLIKFGELPDVCPYNTIMEEFAKESIESEKRACALVREILGMMIEKRTLIDHLTHFRKEFGLPNKLRGMILRHPELFYVSMKGVRNSVFLVEAFDDKGKLLERDQALVIKDQLMELVSESKRMRKERRKGSMNHNNVGDSNDGGNNGFADMDDDDDYDDGFNNLFDWEDSGLDFDILKGSNGDGCDEDLGESREFWTADSPFAHTSGEVASAKEPW